MEKHEFQPKEWVLVRDDDKEPWKLNIFSHKEDDGMFWCVSGWYYQCIPYEGNEALRGKSDAPAEWKVGDKVEVMNVLDEKWYPGEIVSVSKIDKDEPYFVKSEEGFKGRNDGSACLWCSAKHLRKPEEKPEEEFKFGDKVEVDFAGDWREAVIIAIDSSSIPYKVATPDDDIHWCAKSRIRRA